MDRGVWWATILGVANNQAQLSDSHSLLLWARVLAGKAQSKWLKTLRKRLVIEIWREARNGEATWVSVRGMSHCMPYCGLESTGREEAAVIQCCNSAVGNGYRAETGLKERRADAVGPLHGSEQDGRHWRWVWSSHFYHLPPPHLWGSLSSAKSIDSGVQAKPWVEISFFFSSFKSLLNLLQYCFCFLCFDFFACKACGISDAWPGIQATPPPPSLEGEVITTWLPVTSLKAEGDDEMGMRSRWSITDKNTYQLRDLRSSTGGLLCFSFLISSMGKIIENNSGLLWEINELLWMKCIDEYSLGRHGLSKYY